MLNGLFGHKKQAQQKKPSILTKENIVLNLASETPEEAIARCGRMLVAGDYAGETYAAGMQQREKVFSTAIGSHIAIPHGVNEVKDDIKATGIVVLTYPQGIVWNNDTVKLVIGLAAVGDEHLELLGRIVEACPTGDAVEALVAEGDAQHLYDLLNA